MAKTAPAQEQRQKLRRGPGAWGLGQTGQVQGQEQFEATETPGRRLESAGWATTGAV